MNQQQSICSQAREKTRAKRAATQVFSFFTLRAAAFVNCAALVIACVFLFVNGIGALDTPSSGSVRINGVDITGVSREQRRQVRRSTVSFIFQTFNLFPALTALENVRFGADAAGRADAAEVAGQTLDAVGLGDRIARAEELAPSL